MRAQPDPGELQAQRLLVSKSDGKPLVNARVRYTTSGKGSGSSSEGNTDERGVLPLYGLPSGRNDVFLFVPDFGSWTGQVNVPTRITKATPATRLRLNRGGDLIVQVRERASGGQPVRALGSAQIALVLRPQRPGLTRAPSRRPCPRATATA